MVQGQLAKWLAFLIAAVPFGAGATSTVYQTGRYGTSTIGSLTDDIACTGLYFVRRNAGDTAWECATGAVGGDALVANPLSQFAATTSAQLAGVVSNETGSGALVFATGPTFVSPNLGTPNSGDPQNLNGYAPYIHAGSADQLYVDPANCTAGEFPLGINQYGIIEDCTDVVTQAESAARVETECFTLYAPSAEIQATDDVDTLWRAPATMTITEVWCETDTGTVNADLQIDDGTPADVMGVDLVCAATAVSDSTGLTGSMAAGDRLDLEIASVATNPKRLTVCIRYTR